MPNLKGLEHFDPQPANIFLNSSSEIVSFRRVPAYAHLVQRIVFTEFISYVGLFLCFFHDVFISFLPHSVDLRLK